MSDQPVSDAETTLEQALDMLERGRALFEQSEFVKAGELWTRARAAFEREGDRAHAATCLSNLGVLKQIEGDLDQAAGMYEQAYATQKQAGNLKGAAQALGNLANIERDRGNWDGAIQGYLGVVELNEQAQDWEGQVADLTNLGLVWGDEKGHTPAIF